MLPMGAHAHISACEFPGGFCWGQQIHATRMSGATSAPGSTQQANSHYWQRQGLACVTNLPSHKLAQLASEVLPWDGDIVS
eukprot:1239736-Pyramimonas_sp.AAC.1